MYLMGIKISYIKTNINIKDFINDATLFNLIL